MDDIAAAAGVGRATAFRHFSTRDELVAAAWFAAARIAAEELDRIELETVPGDRVALALLDATVKVGEMHPLLTKGARPALVHVTREFADTDERLRRAVERAQRSGAVRRDLPAVVILEHLLATVEAVLSGDLTGEDAVSAARALALEGAGAAGG